MKQIAVGLMSGTSLDGIDVVIAEIELTNESKHIQTLAFETYPYDPSIKKRIRVILESDRVSPSVLCSLNVELAHAYAAAVLSLCQSAKIDTKTIDFVASHGQTIYHIAENQDDLMRSSLQLGDGPTLANLLKTTVVSNFRTADIAQGGQGAPLVPYVDYLSFKDKHEHRALLNIGGISNLTVIPKDGREEDVFAYDTGPGNMMIDRAMEMLYNTTYDQHGEVAASGHLNHSLYDDIMAHPYMNITPPKSTGREVFGVTYTDALLTKYQHVPNEDIIHTLTYVTAASIHQSYLNFIKPLVALDAIYVSGGGVHNDTLLSMLKQLMPEINIQPAETLGISSDAKEALAFLILGYQTLKKIPNNLPSATGAKRKTILGQVSYYDDMEDTDETSPL